MLARRIRSRGATVYAEAHGEVLFLPGTSLSRWKNRFSNRLTAETAKAAPSNKRPRWAHYGKPLKQTISSSTSTRLTRGGGRFYIATGSSANHALFVDQGTSSFQAKILPPWTRGSPSLYESTWVPPGSSSPIGPIQVRGQKAQHFFDKGLQRGFQRMRLRSVQVPGEGISGMREALRGMPASLTNFSGATPWSFAFDTQLREWRAWRDEAFNSRKMLGRDAGPYDRRKRSLSSKAAQQRQSRSTPQPLQPVVKPKGGWKSVAQKKAAAVTQFKIQNPSIKILRRDPDGIVVATAKGPRHIPWSRLYNLLPD